MQFIHKVSKGRRFNQIYIPRGLESIFEAGDLVEVKLIKKKVELFYSRKIEINEFKNKLIREIISFLSRFKDIKQIFMVGSFLTKKIDYNDIDLLIISNKDLDEEIEILIGKSFRKIKENEEINEKDRENLKKIIKNKIKKIENEQK